ncbi:MAG: transposase [Desulfobacterales bacterium]|nr:transposase [Desulfobacterales bacterium]
MELAKILHQYQEPFMRKYTLSHDQLKAFNDILECRTIESGEVAVSCPRCSHIEWKPLSCGNRNCPQCQNHNTSQWIDRQVNKLLPVRYFMITFTLPFQFRALARHCQKQIYSLFFLCVAGVLKDFGLNPKHLGAEIGMTMVLHTNSRSLNYHPHIHVIVPGGGIIRSRRQWKKKKGKYLFKQENLAKVFRARFLAELNKCGFPIPKAPCKWVVDCRNIGKGATAIKYLSKYLYKGVIYEKNIIANINGKVTFRYVDSETKNVKYRTLPGEDFIFLNLQHVLPKGFRRVRDYGFLHANAKKLLSLVQLVLHVVIHEIPFHGRPAFKCPRCKSPMVAIGFRLKPG